MKTKLTLSVDEELVQFAHRQAGREKRSVSKMFADYLSDRRAQLERRPIKRASEMVGSLKSYKIDDSKSGIRKAYAKKHLH